MNDIISSFSLASEVVVPLVIYMCIGWLVRRLKILSREQMTAFNLLIFKLMIPLSLFFNVYQVELGDAVSPKLFLYAFLGVILFSAVTWMIMGRVARDPAGRATLTQGSFRSNFVLFGGIIAAQLCQEQGIAMVGAMTAIIVPTINILSVIVFEQARGGKVTIARIIKEALKNPLVIAGFLGLLVSALHLRLPSLFMDPLRNLGNAATPVALVLLGGILSAESIRSHIRELSIAVVLRLILIPLTAVSIGVFLGFRGDYLVALVAVFASPTAVASAPMAQVMGGNGPLASEIVAATSVCSVVTIFLFIYLLSWFHLI